MMLESDPTQDSLTASVSIPFSPTWNQKLQSCSTGMEVTKQTVKVFKKKEK